MKSYILILILISTITVNSQELEKFPKDDNGNTVFKEIVESKLKQKILFSNAKIWISKTFGNYNDVVQFEDDKDYKIILKGRSDIPISNIINFALIEKDYLTYTITIECKENKYRYIIDDIFIQHTKSVLDIDVKNPITTDEKLKNIEEKKKTLIELKTKDISKMKKSKQKELLDEISYAESAFENDKLMFKQEYKTFIDLIFSLKDRMEINDDF